MLEEDKLEIEDWVRTQQVTFEHRLEGSKGGSYADPWESVLPAEGMADEKALMQEWTRAEIPDGGRR